MTDHSPQASAYQPLFPGVQFPFPIPQTFHTKEDVHEHTLKYFGGDYLSTDAWMKKYALKNTEGQYAEKTPVDMHHRLAREFARIEAKYGGENALSFHDVLSLFDRFRYVLPQGSPMSAIGNPFMLMSAGNCFVCSSPLDSYGGIFQTDQEIAQIQKRRGGVGTDISNIRPKDVFVSNAARTTDGIAGYMERFSNTTREVAQKGRRGALMLSIDCRHPELQTFINIKRDRKKVTGANISIRWCDEFLEAVEKDEEYALRWPCEAPLESAQVVKVVRAKEVWDTFVDAAWECAEPGALFWDTLIRESVADCYSDFELPSGHTFKTLSTNPCGELPLSAYDSCRLMVMNLMGYVRQPFTSSAYFDFDLFADHVGKAQRLMDDLIDLEIECVGRIQQKIMQDPEPESVRRVEISLWDRVLESLEAGRRTGLGITALGDCLASLEIKYGSPSSLHVTESIYASMAVSVERSSIMLAKERGAFPAFSPARERKNPYLNRVFEKAPELRELWKQYGRRNISSTTTAPVGTSSMMALVYEDGANYVHSSTSGIEPVAVSLKTKRRRKLMDGSGDENVTPDFVDPMGDRWKEYQVLHPGFKVWTALNPNESETMSPYWGATSRHIDWETSVDIQAAAQKWVSHSISKTCNLPKSASKKLVHECYMRAWKSGCKGFTVYREGSRTGVILDGSEQKQSGDAREQDQITETHAPRRPSHLPCDIQHTSVKGEKWVVIVGLMKDKPYEVFAGLADKVDLSKSVKRAVLFKHPKKAKKSESVYDLRPDVDKDALVQDVVAQFNNPTYGSLTRSVSLSMRHGVPVQFIVEQLTRDKNADITSFNAALARVLKRYIQDGSTSSSEKSCSQCGASPLTYLEGCVSCVSCGWSKCG